MRPTEKAMYSPVLFLILCLVGVLTISYINTPKETEIPKEETVTKEEVLEVVEVPQVQEELIQEWSFECNDKVLYTLTPEEADIAVSYAENYAKENGYTTCEFFDLVQDDSLDYSVVHMLFDDDKYNCISIEANKHILILYDCFITPRLVVMWQYN